MHVQFNEAQQTIVYQQLSYALYIH